jgi:hypothetical protein
VINIIAHCDGVHCYLIWNLLTLFVQSSYMEILETRSVLLFNSFGLLDGPGISRLLGYVACLIVFLVGVKYLKDVFLFLLMKLYEIFVQHHLPRI